jgi:hypothetical protein
VDESTTAIRAEKWRESRNDFHGRFHPAPMSAVECGRTPIQSSFERVIDRVTHLTKCVHRRDATVYVGDASSPFAMIPAAPSSNQGSLPFRIVQEVRTLPLRD